MRDSCNAVYDCISTQDRRCMLLPEMQDIKLHARCSSHCISSQLVVWYNGIPRNENRIYGRWHRVERAIWRKRLPGKLGIGAWSVPRERFGQTTLQLDIGSLGSVATIILHCPLRFVPLAYNSTFLIHYLYLIVSSSSHNETCRSMLVSITDTASFTMTSPGIPFFGREPAGLPQIVSYSSCSKVLPSLPQTLYFGKPCYLLHIRRKDTLLSQIPMGRTATMTRKKRILLQKIERNFELVHLRLWPLAYCAACLLS